MIGSEFDCDTSFAALAAWERYAALAPNPGTENYTSEQREQDAFTAGYDAAVAACGNALPEEES